MAGMVNTLEQDVQNTDTDKLEDEIIENPVHDDNPEEDDVIEDSDETGDDDQVDDSEKDDEDGDEGLTKEQLDSMSDEEFTEFLNTGKLPASAEKAKIISKPVKPETKPETKPVVKEKPTETKVQDSDSVDYESAYKTIFKPFKANGKEITPKTVEDVISLMQMGANYTKKMQLMAPMKRAVESLDKAKIGEEDLNFLIDIHNGNVEAIKKLLQKHKVDPFELDLETTNYVPNNNIASDSDVEFSDVLKDVQASLPRIQSILTDTWDSASKQAVLKDPNLMRALHEEIEMGRFDEVQNRLEQERMFGRYKGVSDVQAYIDIVTKMVNEQRKTTIQKQEKPVTNTKTLNKTKAAPVRSKPKNQGTTMTVKDLYSMSDEEFEKLSMRDLV